jgi:hypothetical protein
VEAEEEAGDGDLRREAGRDGSASGAHGRSLAVVPACRMLSRHDLSHESSPMLIVSPMHGRRLILPFWGRRHLGCRGRATLACLKR